MLRSATAVLQSAEVVLQSATLVQSTIRVLQLTTTVPWRRIPRRAVQQRISSPRLPIPDPQYQTVKTDIGANVVSVHSSVRACVRAHSTKDGIILRSDAAMARSQHDATAQP